MGLWDYFAEKVNEINKNSNVWKKPTEVCNPEFNSWNPCKVGNRESTLQSCPLPSTGALWWFVCVHIHASKDIQIEKIKYNFFIKSFVFGVKFQATWKNLWYIYLTKNLYINYKKIFKLKSFVLFYDYDYFGCIFECTSAGVRCPGRDGDNNECF